MIVVTAAGGRTGAAVVRALRAHGKQAAADRAHGFVGSPCVLAALLGRPPRTLAEHLAALPLPAAG